MADSSSNETEVKLLPDAADTRVQPAPAIARPAAGAPAISGVSPQRQLSELPKDELRHLAEEFGLDSTAYVELADLVSAIHDRRQMIAALDRDAMLDVVRWGRRPVTANATREQIAQEIARIRSMRFAGLSQRGLVVLARMRGVGASESEPIPSIVKRLRRKEGFFQKFNRKRRAFIGSLVAGMVGHADSSADYKFLPDQSANPGVAPARTSSLKEDIEEAGLIGGITARLKKNADSYLNQKLDEIETRLDRKLDEIDRRLGDWRDKEIANRIRILKITLWASVIVGAASLIYSYVTVVLFPAHPPGNVPAMIQPRAPGDK
ncbi:MAG TPA: hypothetical protein VG326_13165 [Tepidisphaeraceae bacterium]|jgi:hypothetical protein|nr:hypothetical protein [Tepidisphaeraceae bacterium]